MIKLPVCPHCNSVYYYKEVNKLSGYKKIECRNCGKVFEVSKLKSRIIFSLIYFVLLILLNVLFLAVFNAGGFVCIFITFALICLYVFLLPYTVKFKNIEK